MAPKAGLANPKNPTWPGWAMQKICLKLLRGFMPAQHISGWCLSKNGNELRYPVQATMASQLGNSEPSLKTTLSSNSSKLSLCSSAPRSTMAVTKPSFLQPNLEKADVFWLIFSSAIFRNTLPWSEAGPREDSTILAIWFTYPIQSPNTYGLEYLRRLVFKSVTRPLACIRGIRCPCLPRMAMAHLLACLEISFVMSEPDSPEPTISTRLSLKRSGVR
mmetsp:Transcript_28999/g.39832  ORF Transcript_28999/g.39832 Transcript_28999/m.39832 type:complete len:218 (+) Transcript_28999:617-1270(+)